MIRTAVYTYGLPLGPTSECAEAVDEQMRRARIYHNELLELERTKRAVYREIVGEVAHVAAIQTQIDEVTSEIQRLETAARAGNQKSRKRVRDPETRRQLQSLRAKRKELRQQRKAAKAAVRDDPDMQARIAALDERATEWQRGLRAQCGVYWGTYLLVEEAHQRRRRERMDPQFRRWDGSGRIGVQIQGGMPVAGIVDGSDSRLQIDRTPRVRYTRRHPEGRSVPDSGWLRIRIGSDGRAPVWATFPLVYHRPLPRDGVIKRAWVQRRRIGTRWRWELQVTLQEPVPDVAPGRGTAAVHVGWRVRQDGLRVGYVRDTSGEGQELLLPRAVLDALDHAASLRSIRDRHHDGIRARLRQWMSAQSHVPEWLTAATKHMDRWRSTQRLTRLVYTWRASRFSGDAAMYDALEAWRRKDRHLYQWECDERAKARGRRKDIYRQLAADLTSRYSTILLGDTDLRQVARRAAPDQEDPQHATARRNRTRAAVGELQDAIKAAASKRGVAVDRVSAQHVTDTCHACGERCAFDAAEHVHHACAHCGVVWDQDDNAAVNMLGRVASGEAAE